MENIIWILSIALLFAIIVAFRIKSSAKDLQKDLMRNFSALRNSDEKLSLSQRNNKINQQIKSLQLLRNSAEFKFNEAQKRIAELKKGISVKDELYEGIKNKSNDSISRITSLLTDFLYVQYEVSAQYLETKKRPARVEAQRIRELKAESKFHTEQYRQMLYKYEELLQLFPELTDYVDDFATIQQLENTETLENLKEDFDRVKFYVSSEEYAQLSIDERNQLALDRYLNGRKSNWQIGRDYELFCGRLYEQKGWNVEYVGMEQKLQDLGRDLVAQKNNIIHIIQCKYWSQKKEIHEKHITQLFGTTIAYGIDKDPLWEIVPVFMTNIQLSETAQKFADKLNVKVVYQNLEEFPRIKCNLNKDEFGLETRIYHLPFDQQYDRTKINGSREFYASNVEEAVAKGFRRAFRYYDG